LKQLFNLLLAALTGKQAAALYGIALFGGADYDQDSKHQQERMLLL